MSNFTGNNWLEGLAGKLKSAKQSIKQTKARKIGIVSVGIIGLVAVTFTLSHQYIKNNTYEVYPVFVGSKQAGVVSDPQVIDQWVGSKQEALNKKYPNVQMILNEGEISIKTEKAYKVESDDQAALKQLSQLITSQAAGVELKVNGKVVGIVKNQKEAIRVLDGMKYKYAPEAKKAGKDANKVSILSLSTTVKKANLTPGKKIQSVQFIEKVHTNEVKTEPEQIIDADTLLKKLMIGSTKPIKYTVQEGDCVGCVADKFNISKQLIYQNNKWINDDMIKVGDVLDLTVQKPDLNVKTVEKVVEKQEIAYSTVIVRDKSLKAGKTVQVRAGKNGEKTVVYRLTKINGLLMTEEVLGETLGSYSVAEIIRKGTKVLAEGTGRFAIPVSGSRMTSSFGSRWGKMHKGIDLVGSKTIKAADSGKVSFAGVKNGYGNVIIIDHNNGFTTLYGHLSKISVTQGEVVEQGEKIGVMGDTGLSFGVHLHFEVMKNGRNVNPTSYL